MKYENRIVCFIDILGFKNIVANTVDGEDDNETEILKINNLLLRARNILDIDTEKVSKSKIVTQFSDSLVISFNVNEESEIFWTLVEILHLIINFAYGGYLLRGGISYGKLIHDDKLVYGPGLISAYQIESSDAIYPRIILDESILNLAQKHRYKDHNETQERELIEDIITKDEDNFYYIDYIEKVQGELDDPELDIFTYLNKLNKVIVDGLKHPSKDVRSKYIWLKKKYNRYIKKIKSKKNIQALQKENNLIMLDYYSNVQIIS